MNLYHATIQDNIDSIKNKGLTIGNNSRWQGMNMQNHLYFALDPEVAISYVEESDDYNDEEIIIISVPLEKIDLDSVRYDFNVHCDTIDDIATLAYSKNIPIENLSFYNEDNYQSLPGKEFMDLYYSNDRLENELFDIVINDYYDNSSDWWGNMDDNWIDNFS